jgi:hypothetical protein
MSALPSKTMRTLACFLAAMLLLGGQGNAQAQAAAPLQLQVLASSLAVRDAPREDAAAIARVERGSLFDVLEQRGDWIRIRLGAGDASGWVVLGPGEHGDDTVALSAAAAPVRYVEEAEDAVVRVRPGAAPRILTLPPIDPFQVAPPQANLPRESLPIPDRWRVMQGLGFKFPLYDPYHQNPLKGDLPVLRHLAPDLFVNLGVVSDSLLEWRRLPTPVAGTIGQTPGASDVFGHGRQAALAQNIIMSLGLVKGDTTFRPPDYELRFVPVYNINHARVQEFGVLRANPADGDSRTDHFLAVQELFGDLHLRNVSERYDFDSLRVGIQPFTSDFRGFLFHDAALGVRLFGNRDNNRWQYNLGWFRRVEKDTNSGLNNVGKPLRKDDVFAANLYRQDWPLPGFTSQVTVIHNRNRETDRHYDTNGFLVRPALVGTPHGHGYRVTYLGYSGDGHFGRWNLSTSSYLALGTDDANPIAGARQRIRAAFHASELSRDFSWLRLRANLLLASGDSNPYDGVARGFDAIVENPQFAGADSSFFIRQGLPLIGGGGVAISGRNGVLPSLRSSKDQGQSNFVNPGLMLVGAGADADLAPQWRVFSNISLLRFGSTRVLAALRNQPMPSRAIGIDLSAGFHWRPHFTQNVVINGSAALLKPGAGLKALYGKGQGRLVSMALNAIFTF